MIRTKVTLYVEGGSKGDLDTECRKGFRLFLEKAGLSGRMPRIVACGSRGRAFKDFCIALSNKTPDEFPVLLVDSEGPVTAAPWQHVRHRVGDEWHKPEEGVDEHLHLMVQTMEAWFLADVSALKAYFGPKFRDNALPKNKPIESISKEEIASSMNAAIQDCPKKKYKKGRDSFEILCKLDPNLVAQSSSHAKRFLDQLKLLAKSAG